MVGKYLLDIIDTFSQKGIFVDTYITQEKSDAYRVAKREAGNYQMIACSGGDGTLDEVMAGVLKSGHKPVVGYIPAGSTNDFARSLQLPSDMKEAAKIIVDGKTFSCDIGSFNGLYFVYVAAFGVFTEVSYKTDQNMKNILGHMAYVLEGAKNLLEIKPYHMKFVIDDCVELEGDFIYGMMTNSESVGGIEQITGNDVELDDGEFELLLIRNPITPLDWTSIITGLVNKESDGEFIYYLKAKKVVIETKEDIPWTLDGEDGGVHQNSEIKVLEKYFDIMVDENYPRDDI